MQQKLFRIFNKDKNIIIGTIHFPPLLGYKEFPGFDIALENALTDLKAYENGGVDGIIFENNYDFPHKEFVDHSIAASMLYLGEKIRLATTLPVGISVLWNDYKTALSIAKIINLQFIRTPVFVDIVETQYGEIKGEPQKIKTYQKKIGAEDIILLTDIHVKHAKLLSQNNLEESAKLAVEAGSDALIVTGKWTGDPPDLNELKSLRKAVDSFPILIGSGVSKDNIRDLFTLADGCIVSTSLKNGQNKQHEVNVKSYDQRIVGQKVKELVTKLKEL